jgi:methyltransferase (TIGR00027 family)
MREGTPSVTARQVAAYRLSCDRLAAPFGDPAADDRLARGVAGPMAPDSDRMARYLRGRTAFFDRVVVNALEHGAAQVAVIGAGYDGRALRYARPGVRWFEVDHPATQRDKRARIGHLGIETPHITFLEHDLRHSGLAGALTGAGYDRDAPSLMTCEGVAVYLDEAVLEHLLRELRAVAATGSRLAVSARTPVTSPAGRYLRERFDTAVAALGEPALNSLSADGVRALLAATGWRATGIPERSRQAGFVLAAPA